MRTLHRALLTAAILAATTAASRAAAAANDSEVLTVHDRWRMAIGSADVAALETVYADDLVYVHSDGRVENKEQFLAPVRAGRMRLALSACDAPRVQVYEQAAVVSVCYELRAAGGPSRHRFLTVYVKHGDSWRIVAQQTTRMPDAP